MIYEQSNLDGLAVSEHQGRLQFIVHEYPDTAASELDRDAVLELIQRLSEWAYPVHTPEAENRSLIEQLIDKAVKDQVAAVLPLHLAPTADRWGYADPDGRTCHGGYGCDSNTPHTKYGSSCGAPRPDEPAYCRIDGCTFPSTPGAIHFEHDPEPHDVGHHDVPEATTAGRWEAELRRDVGKSIPLPYCGACGHSRIRHDSGRCSVRHCLCNWDGKP